MDENTNLPGGHSGSGETNGSTSSSSWWDNLGPEQSRSSGPQPSAPQPSASQYGQQGSRQGEPGHSSPGNPAADGSASQGSPWAASNSRSGFSSGNSWPQQPSQSQQTQPVPPQYPSQPRRPNPQGWGSASYSQQSYGPYPGYQAQPQPGQGPVGQGTVGQSAMGQGAMGQGTMGQPSGQAPVQQATPRRTKGLKAGAVALVAVLAAGAGGLSGWAVNAGSGHDSAAASPSATVTKVVQGNSSAPDWTATASAVSDSVVSISITSGSGKAAGSGVVLDAKGNIVTNNHVVSSAAGGDIQVSLGDKTYTATVVGTDASSDLAVIRLSSPPKDLKPISFADSDKLSVGAPVMAIGNPLGLSGSVTTGIISALNRPVSTSSSEQQDESGSDVVVTNAIQTSAPINPGNSGGALVNASGALIGINSSIASLSSGSSSSQSGSIGIGFAIPANLVKNITGQLISTGKAKHAFLGLTTQDATATLDGVQVSGAGVRALQSGSPADKAGVKEGDVVIKMNSTTVTSGEGLVGLVRSRQVGEKVTLTLVRDGSEQKVSATLAAAQE